ncbi:hypothetical protein [Paraburkholderia dipogonis]|uniref:hypothetical protein n=1 Tax=Paraburkholderia dipogonis TaxID=1211383 RepID=UPI0038BC5F54
MDLSAVDEPGMTADVPVHDTARIGKPRFCNTKQSSACATMRALLPYNAAAFFNRLSHITVEVNPTEALVRS